ncbi:hydroxyacid dehydrogenase [Isoptericola sp. 4D.3]|uniref:Hydroxyacid dehydrogenase n=1 Tax=Isoptericola peretonis TaxID=2918523 RepID=A0ABT0J1V6_9MICO|nr:hydroxyacid dehydrogenase [Isoptericola sp. 4D.3]
MTRPTAAFAMRDAALLPDLFGDDALARLRAVADVAPDVLTSTAAAAEALGDVDVLVTGWGAPRLDDDLLRRARRLRAVVHAAGSVKPIVTPAVWERGVLVSSAAAANAQPVAEYTLAMVLLAGKRVLEAADVFAAHRSFGGWELPRPMGNHGLTVGVVGASRIGRQVIRLLEPFDVEVLLHDPWVDSRAARALGATAVTLDDLARASDVVTVHAPDLPETYRMIGARQLARMPDAATLVNTARGRLVDTPALTREVVSGRLRAVLDVTDPEPLPAEHPLFDAPGALLTPHVAGSLGNELRRLGDLAVREVELLVAGRPLEHEVRPEHLTRTA